MPYKFVGSHLQTFKQDLQNMPQNILMKPVPPKVTDMVPAIPETGMWGSQQPTQRCVSVRAGAVGPWQHVTPHTATRSAARARAALPRRLGH